MKIETKKLDSVKKYIQQNGWIDECQTRRSDKYMTVQIAFDNQGRDDEVEFDIKAYDTNELAKLFEDFCEEEKCEKNSVTGIYIVKTADNMSDLLD